MAGRMREFMEEGAVIFFRMNERLKCRHMNKVREGHIACLLFSMSNLWFVLPGINNSFALLDFVHVVVYCLCGGWHLVCRYIFALGHIENRVIPHEGNFPFHLAVFLDLQPIPVNNWGSLFAFPDASTKVFTLLESKPIG